LSTEEPFPGLVKEAPMKKKLKTLYLSKETVANLTHVVSGTLTLETLTTCPIQPGSLLDGCPPITTMDTTLSGGC
jgi:hypothetical protein